MLGTRRRPRLSVFRSNKHIYAQIVDDTNNATLASANDEHIKSKNKKNKTEIALMVGETVAKKAIKKKIKSVVFDRSGYRYHGRVKALADGARKGGLKF